MNNQLPKIIEMSLLLYRMVLNLDYTTFQEWLKFFQYLKFRGEKTTKNVNSKIITNTSNHFCSTNIISDLKMSEIYFEFQLFSCCFFFCGFY